MPRYTALPTNIVTAYRAGALDAHGSAPERHISDGGGNPCRHCLKDIPQGAGMLVLAHKPFTGTHPYAEVGPIFLCTEACSRGGGAGVPEILMSSPEYLLKGYGWDDRIVYGTGAIVRVADMSAYLDVTFGDSRVAYVHARSARNNCYQLRVDRGE